MRPEDITWIFGSSRSGSTWLLRMLADHEALVPVDETGFGHHLGVWRPLSLAWGTADPSDIPALTTYDHVKAGNPDYVFSDAYREQWTPQLRRFLLDRLALQWPGPPKRAMVIKEPGGSHVADWLLELTPGARLVFLLRDGRDVVESWLDAYRAGAWGEDEGTYPLSVAGRLAFVRWQATVWRYRTETVRRAYAAHDPARRLFMRYEELLADPAGELARVHELLLGAADAERIGETVARHAYETTPPSQRGEGRAVRWAQPGRWAQSMSEAEQAAMDEIMGPLLAELGYPLVRVGG